MGVVYDNKNEGDSCRFVVDLTKDEYESMDACFLVVINRDRVSYIEKIKGKT